MLPTGNIRNAFRALFQETNTGIRDGPAGNCAAPRRGCRDRRLTTGLQYLPMIEPVARIHIELQDIQPRIWRRVDVPLTSHLLTLHYIIQFAFGWTDSHLFQFTIGNRNYGVPSEEDEFWGLKFYRAAGLRLRTLVARGVEQFVYVYDFGDDWRHEIVIERVAEGEANIGYPAFVDGKRRGPPEDVGGIYGFMQFLEAVRNPMHDEYRDMIRWYGKPFDPFDIDEERIRMGLLALARRRRRGLGVELKELTGLEPAGK